MAIKNPDGTPYVLPNFNKIRAEQSVWNKSEIKLHNMTWESIVIVDRTGEKLTFEDILIHHVQEEVKKDVVETLEEPKSEDSVNVWCLPASSTVHSDPLYGSSFNRVKYGKKFVFEAIIIEQTDIVIQLWANTKTITVNSIIYPQNSDKRWWKVSSNNEYHEGGWLITATISDLHPDFS